METIFEKPLDKQVAENTDHIANLETAYQVFTNNSGTELVNDVDLNFDSSLYQTLVFVYRYGRTGTYYQRSFYKDYYNLSTLDTAYNDAFAFFSLDSNNGHLKVIGGGTYRPFLYKVFGFKAKT